jgi:virginiamycin B lyase
MTAMARSTHRRFGSGLRGNQPRVEGLEERRLMAVSYQVFPLPSQESPSSMVVLPDGDIWLSHVGAASLSKFTPSTGAITDYPTPSASITPGKMISGPGGDLWFINNPPFSSATNIIGSVNPTTGLVTAYTVTKPGARLMDLAAGADGNIWFTDSTNAAIGVFNTTTHTSSEFPLPQTTDIPDSITAGPDGNLWFTVPQAGIAAVGDINPSTHAISLTPVPGSYSMSDGIVAGSDGNLWFSQYLVQPYGLWPTYAVSINPTTRAVNRYQSAGGFDGMATGPDGNIWYANVDQEINLGEINLTTHATSLYNVPYGLGGATQFAFVTGPNDTLWAGGNGYIYEASIIPANQSAIAGTVVLNANGNNASSFLNNVTVFLDLKNDGQLDAGDPIANTNVFGDYFFNGLTPGTYTVRLAPYPGNIATSPNNSTQTITVTGGQLGTPPQLGLLPSSSLLPLTYDPSPFGTHNSDVQTAEVNGLYNLILHRAPDATGGAAAVAYLKNDGSLGQLAADLINSAEYETGVVASYYQNYLRRTGSPAEISAWVAQMQQGVSEEQVASTFLNSAEYSALFSANATFVQALYGDILGRLPMSSEISGWVAAMNAGTTRAQVIAGFLGSSEAANRGVDGLYGIIFARTAEPVGQSAGVAALQSGVTLAQLATGMFGSAEFIARANATVG